tara:strand:+ start:2412 stop:3488 length:1077 start_codon:yes stop_codon:yes gene_type:complete
LKPLLSTIICIYNGKKTLDAAINSLLDQNYPKDEYEIILLDDGSSDGSIDICKKYINFNKKNKLKITYVYQDNSGLSGARNTGIAVSKGELIAFMDQDAVADKNWLLNIKKAFSDEKTGGIGGRLNLLNDHSKVSKFINIVRFHQMFGPSEYMNDVIGTNMAYNRSVFYKIGGFYEMMKYRGDETNFIIRLKQSYNISYASNAIVYHPREESFLKWLKTEYIESMFSPTILKVPNTFFKKFIFRILFIEQLLTAFIPVWLIIFLFSTTFSNLYLSLVIIGCIRIIQRHLIRRSAYEIRKRLKVELGLIFCGTIFFITESIKNLIKGVGLIHGIFRFYPLKEFYNTIPNIKKVKYTITN